MSPRPVTFAIRCARTRTRRLRALLGTVLPLVLFAQLSAQHASLTVEREGNHLRLSAPQLRFLTGQPLQQLRDGRSVAYVLSVTLEVERGDPRTTHVNKQVVFSYDLWEERFSVAQVDDPKTRASHLTSAAAEAWCLDLLELPLRLAPADKTFVVKFECWLRDDGAQPGDAPSASTLTGLIDLFSRTAREAPPRWEATSRRLRLSNLVDRTAK